MVSFAAPCEWWQPPEELVTDPAFEDCGPTDASEGLYVVISKEDMIMNKNGG